MDSLPCTGKGDIWFSQDPAVLDEAARTCRDECPALEACAERAKTIRPACGVWGGQRYHAGKPVIGGKGGRPRKGKRVYGWTPEDDAKLLGLRERGMTWGQISVNLDRDEGGCYKRWKVLTAEVASTA